MFEIAAIFSDHCVLQREKNICIFGYGEDGNAVFVELFDKNGVSLGKNFGKIKNGRWEVYLPPVFAQEGCFLVVKCEDFSKTFCDISIGEVWLAGGQSNMEFELRNCSEGPDELAKEKNPNVRFYYTQKIGWMDQKFYDCERNTAWGIWGSDGCGAWSAVGYFFAKKLAKELGVTVGVIGCNWGGTSATAWIPNSCYEKDSDLKTYIDEYAAETAGKSIEQQCKEYDDYEIENNIWQEKSAQIYAENPNAEWAEVEAKLGKCPWPGPKSCKNPYRPGGLYECMIKRVLPYSLRGFIWYQGESDDHKPRSYEKLFGTLIHKWREDWNDEKLPFLFVQLPVHRYKQDKDFKHWCLIREAQQKVFSGIKNTGMACALDLGDFNDIHPRGKKVIAERLALGAMNVAYNKVCETDAFAPMLKDYICVSGENGVNGRMILSFNFVKDGFVVRQDKKRFEEYKMMEENAGEKVPEDFTGFEIAGENGIYYPAEFEFDKSDCSKIILSSKMVENPVMARYAWFNYGPVTIFEKNGLPLVPFRTCQKDSDGQNDSHAEIQQIMTV